MINTDLLAYYRQRAGEYEKIYQKPERQLDLQKATAILQNAVAGKRVVEIACGTGFWTQKMAETAASIFATDINTEVLEIAQSKTYGKAKPSFARENIFTATSRGNFDFLFGGFIWSHILHKDLDLFISNAEAMLPP